MKPPDQFPVEEVTQRQLIDILCLEEEIKIIRGEIRKKKARIAEALALGAIVENGLHEYKLNGRKGVKVYPFRGAILRTDEDDSTPERQSRTPVTQKKAAAKPLLILAPRSPIEEEQAPVA